MGSSKIAGVQIQGEAWVRRTARRDKGMAWAWRERQQGCRSDRKGQPEASRS